MPKQKKSGNLSYAPRVMCFNVCLLCGVNILWLCRCLQENCNSKMPGKTNYIAGILPESYSKACILSLQERNVLYKLHDSAILKLNRKIQDSSFNVYFCGYHSKELVTEYIPVLFFLFCFFLLIFFSLNITDMPCKMFSNFYVFLSSSKVASNFKFNTTLRHLDAITQAVRVLL